MTITGLTEIEIKELVPQVDSITRVVAGGQKTVFKVRIKGKYYALKVLRLEGRPPGAPEGEATEDEPPQPEEAYSRALREVQILSECNIPEIVRLGPVSLRAAEAGQEYLILYTEEWISGRDVRTVIEQDGPLSIAEVVRLGRDVNRAIEKLWSLAKIHRDIKPANIMQRAPGAGYVLLDLGLALDLQDVSLTNTGQVPGTLPYFSPEQLDFMRKRNMDFRSDMYSLGVVMYEATTGKHPYWKPGMKSNDTIGCILGAKPAKPSDIRKEVPPGLEEVILRLLAKSPHLRYRTCEQLDASLEAVAVG